MKRKRRMMRLRYDWECKIITAVESVHRDLYNVCASHNEL